MKQSPKCRALAHATQRLAKTQVSSENVAMDYFAKKHWHHRKIAPWVDIIEWIMLVSLAHPRVVSGWLESVIHYCEVEGVNYRAYVRDTIAMQPEYRKLMRKAGLVR